MDVRFSAGEFAKLCGISKQTLLYYDKEDIIKPKFKDPQNGYRYYTADQLEQVDSILILKEIGIPLSEIREHMKNRSLSNCLELFTSQEKALEEKIRKLEAVKHRIKMKRASLELFQKQDPSFHIVHLKEQLLCTEPVGGERGLVEVDLSLKKIMQSMKESGAGHIYQVGDIVGKEDLLKENFLSFQYSFVPVEQTEENMQILTKKEGDYAVQFHFGSYTSMGETYKSMLQEISFHKLEIIGDAYEFCILDALTSADPSHYATQIQIPVEGMN